ncbi:hypothetical protein GCM10008027_45740 [Pseudoalteromonas gelatinilytica]|uniref:Uncharacterized protein n=1 Tax=Pseudoalteromonas gelatinilytica TaxID=1703256 RepID=A0ABQ1UD15_9GAMM|nr:hypothetical protein GCM10008027_45740 [Pseudoalteromonas profundi]
MNLAQGKRNGVRIIKMHLATMDKLIKPLISIACALFLAGCSSTGKIDYMVAGGATQKGNQIWVQAITFDDSWGFLWEASVVVGKVQAKQVVYMTKNSQKKW